MQITMLRMRLVVAALACGLALGGCAADLDQIYVDQAQYDYYSCHQLEGLKPGLNSRAKQLQDLINRADRGTGGAMISTLTYQPELDSIHGQLRLIDQVQHSKGCDKPQDADKTGGKDKTAARDKPARHTSTAGQR